MEFTRTKRSSVRPKIADKDLAARLFLDSIVRMDFGDAFFFEARTERQIKRISSRIRTRLWRYAEIGKIKFREFNLWTVEGGVKLIRNMDPYENHAKRNLRKRGRVVEGGGLENR